MVANKARVILSMVFGGLLIVASNGAMANQCTQISDCAKKKCHNGQIAQCINEKCACHAPDSNKH